MTRYCVECVAELLEGKRTEDEIAETEGDCTECDKAACGNHAHLYSGGWQHESCHEMIDYTRADEGQY